MPHPDDGSAWTGNSSMVLTGTSERFETKRFDVQDSIWYHLTKNHLRLKLKAFERRDAINSKGQPMTSRKTRKDTKTKGVQIGAEQVRSIVKQARKSSHDLVAAGVDRERLESRLSEIHKHLDQEDHDPVKLRSVLTELQADLIKVENGLIDSGVLQMLHQILGTGVPPPR
jgi:hypothetical protein